MKEEWKDIEDFPGYGISNWGRVSNDSAGGRLLTQVPNQQGILQVGLVKREPGSVGPGKQFKRSVALLVAKAFLPDPPEHWSSPTPIHRDGDKTHNHLDNLDWRPRWFAISYHQQFDTELFHKAEGELEVVQTGEQFDSPREAAVKYGILVKDLVIDVTNQNGVFPVGLKFVFI